MDDEDGEICAEQKAEITLEVEAKKYKKEHPKPVKAGYETKDDAEVEIKSKTNKRDSNGIYQEAKSLVKNVNMQINDHPIWIKVEPTNNRFAFYQSGRWNIGNLESLP